MKLIYISGKARHGKDTVAGFMRDGLEQDGYRVLITHYGDLVKYVCKTFFGWNGEKDEAGRSLLQYVGTDKVRASYPNFWADFVTDIVYLFEENWDFVIIPDCRFKNEVQPFTNSYLVRVERANGTQPFDNGLTPEQAAHPSETELDDLSDYPTKVYYIDNCADLFELELNTLDILQEIVEDDVR